MHCIPTGEMSHLLCLYALSMVAVVTHTPYVAIASGEGECYGLTLTCNNKQCVSFTLPSVILTTNAQPTALPNTYVVPVGGNVTFTCTSSGGDLLWSLNLTGSMGHSTIRSNTEGLKTNPMIIVSDESTATTAIVTFHNISLESNPSLVECHDLNITDGSKVHAVLRIIVEGEFSTVTVAQAKWMYNISTLSKTMQVCIKSSKCFQCCTLV